MILYMAHCPVSYSFYYGKTINTLEHRRRLHFYEAKRGKTGSAFHAAIRKYGPDTFTWHIIKTPRKTSPFRAEMDSGRAVRRAILSVLGPWAISPPERLLYPSNRVQSRICGGRKVSLAPNEVSARRMRDRGCAGVPASRWGNPCP